MARLIMLWAAVCSLLVSTGLCRTWYIKPDGTGDAPTIQAGIDSTADGDTVLVAAGVYNESIEICYTEIYLLSESGPVMTIIQGEPGTAGVFAGYRFVRVEGFTVTGVMIGIHYDSSWGDIVGNIVYDCSHSAILFGGMSLWIHPVGTIEKNLVYDSLIGIEVSGAIGSGTSLIGNTVFGCTSGIDIFNPEGSAVCVSCNLVSGCTGAGISQAVDCSPYPCGPPPDLSCNVVWGNVTNYFGTEPGATDMIVCPMLCYAHLGDFHVCDASPCLPQNNPYGCHVGAFGEGCSCGPTRTVSITWGAIKSMYR